MGLPWKPIHYSGWGGHSHFGTQEGTTRPPIVFVHGRTRNASDWNSHAQMFLDDGYLGDELWAISFDGLLNTHDEMASQLDDFVATVEDYTRSEVSLVCHSLGVTAGRYWMDAYDRYSWVSKFVGLAGPNHGTSTSWMAPSFYLPIESAMNEISRTGGRPSWFLREMNEDETPGDVEYYTVRGARDSYFVDCPLSPELEGAEENVVLPYGHDGVKDSVETRNHLRNWLPS